MDTAIYLGTAALTVGWSVWTYLLWADKAQLPEDSKRFDGIDSDFKELMIDAATTPSSSGN